MTAKLDYRTYIQSDAWRDRHPAFRAVRRGGGVGAARRATTILVENVTGGMY